MSSCEMVVWERQCGRGSLFLPLLKVMLGNLRCIWFLHFLHAVFRRGCESLEMSGCRFREVGL